MHSRVLHWLPFAIGCFFCVRSAFTLILVRGFGLPPQFGIAFSLCAEFGIFGIVAIDLLRPRTGGSETNGMDSSVAMWVMAYVAFAGVSLVWSNAASPTASFAYWCGVACDVAILFLLFSRQEPSAVCASTMT